MHADDRLQIDTPEQIALELPIAGVGSRFVAVAVDTLLQGVLAVGALVIVGVGLPGALRFAPSWARTLGPALLLLLLFCLFWGYFAFFEILWSGRTPGKRIAGIRVIQESGRPVSVYEAIARNVVRVVDVLPGFYAVGVVVMLMNRHSRRLGDYVAGTIVVHDAPGDVVRPEMSRDDDHAMSQAAVTGITAEELVLIETYLRRRFDLDSVVRDEMAAQIAARISAKIGVKPDDSQPIDRFLEGVARRVRDTARFH